MANQSTKQLVEVVDIRENVVFLRNSSLRSILEVSSINFELRSEEEQTAILQNFQRFLNSIDFPLQMVVQSRKFNLSQYLELVEQATGAQTNELLRIQASEYLKFVRELAELANIMSKKFYIIVPFFISETPSSAKGLLDQFKSTFKSAAEKQLVTLSEEQFTAYKNQLLQRSELITDGLIGMGLKVRTLQADELQAQFFSLYNPDAASAASK